MRPMGPLPPDSHRVRPKKYPTALNPPAVCGVHSTHWPEQSSAGAAAVVFLTMNSRRPGQSAFATSSLEFTTLVLPSGHSMLDCPEQIQTSPIRTLLSVMVFLP